MSIVELERNPLDGKLYVKGYNPRDIIHSLYRVKLRQYECPLCWGKGFVDEMPGLDCGTCNGTGFVNLPSEIAIRRQGV
jgi:rubredoxin